MATPYARATQAAPPIASARAPRPTPRHDGLGDRRRHVGRRRRPGGPAEGTLRVALEPTVRLDPAFASSDAEIAVLNAVYDYLVDVDVDNAVQPRLAYWWTVSDDGLSYTFDLVEGATFHDGSPLTADDVVWTFDRLRDAELELPTADLYANVASDRGDRARCR
jgi:peptide/nickel transport system substrate-binding protein